MSWTDKLEEYECGCRVISYSDGGYGIEYCSKHYAAPDMFEALGAALGALEFVEKYYMPSYSAASEMWAFVNGYEGSPDIRAILELAKK